MTEHYHVYGAVPGGPVDFVTEVPTAGDLDVLLDRLFPDQVLTVDRATTVSLWCAAEHHGSPPVWSHQARPIQAALDAVCTAGPHLLIPTTGPLDGLRATMTTNYLLAKLTPS